MIVIEMQSTEIRSSGEMLFWEGPFERIDVTGHGHLYGYKDEHVIYHAPSYPQRRLVVVPYDPEKHQRTIKVTVELTEEELLSRIDQPVTHKPVSRALRKFNKACADAYRGK